MNGDCLKCHKPLGDRTPVQVFEVVRPSRHSQQRFVPTRYRLCIDCGREGNCWKSSRLAELMDTFPA